MDVLEKKYSQKNIRKLLKILSFNKNIIQLVGTGSMQSQWYPADFDFLSIIHNKLNDYQTYQEFKKILNNINKEPNLYFIELKIQNKNGEKHKIYKIDEFDENFFDKNYDDIKLELIKIDLIIFLEGKFKEVSIIYFFDDKPLDINSYITSLLKDQKDFYNEGQFYKSLKRLLVATKYMPVIDKNLIISITQLFNSMTGKLYQIKNELDASLIYYNKYNNDKLLKLFIDNMGLRGIQINQLEELSKQYGNIINREGKKFYELYKLKVGQLPKYNTVKPIY